MSDYTKRVLAAALKKLESWRITSSDPDYLDVLAVTLENSIDDIVQYTGYALTTGATHFIAVDGFIRFYRSVTDESYEVLNPNLKPGRWELDGTQVNMRSCLENLHEIQVNRKGEPGEPVAFCLESDINERDRRGSFTATRSNPGNVDWLVPLYRHPAAQPAPVVTPADTCCGSCPAGCVVQAADKGQSEPMMMMMMMMMPKPEKP